jgi:hypothetical protein
MLLPGTVAPALRCETLAHGPFDLAQDAPPGGTYVFFHRGRHCKWTRLALKDLDDRIGDFAIRGVRIVAVSADGRDAVSRLREQMQLIRLPLGHSLDPSTVAGDWGLYLTQNSTEAEAPPLHWEPAPGLGEGGQHHRRSLRAERPQPLAGHLSGAEGYREHDEQVSRTRLRIAGARTDSEERRLNRTWSWL